MKSFKLFVAAALVTVALAVWVTLSVKGEPKSLSDVEKQYIPRMHEPSPDGFTISGEPFTVPPELGYTVEEVWNVVYNLNEYYKWNSFVYDVTMFGPIQVGTVILLHLNMACGMSPEMIDSFYAPNQISWCFYIKFFPNFLLQSSHIQTVEQNDDGQIVVKSWETFNGWLTSLVKFSQAKSIKNGFDTQQKDLLNYLIKLKKDQ